MFGIAERTVYRWVRDLDFPMSKLPNRENITTIAQINAWIESRRIVRRDPLGHARRVLATLPPDQRLALLREADLT